MDVTTLNKKKGNEIIRNFHSLLTTSTEKTVLSYVSSSDENRVLAMHEYLTKIIRMRQVLSRVFLRQIKRIKFDFTISRSCFKLGDYVNKGYHVCN